MGRQGHVQSPEDVEGLTLVDVSADLPLFRYFLDAAPDARPWPFARHSYMGGIGAIRLRVLEGAGVAVLPEYFIRRDLQSGRLVDLTPGHPLKTDSFRLIWRAGHPLTHELEALADVLRSRPRPRRCRVSSARRSPVRLNLAVLTTLLAVPWWSSRPPATRKLVVPEDTLAAPVPPPRDRRHLCRARPLCRPPRGRCRAARAGVCGMASGARPLRRHLRIPGPHRGASGLRYRRQHHRRQRGHQQRAAAGHRLGALRSRDGV